jgi:methionyl aminopeptidase
MDLNEIEKWKKAGKITSEVREYAKTLIVKGASLLEVTELIEKKIYELGAKPAFPVTISLNEISAHYSADFNENIIFDNDVVKVDIGAERDGYIGDTAFTIDLTGNYTELLLAAKDALDEAIKVAKANVKLSDIGKVIQNAIEKRGFSPITNLTGHGIERYNTHSSPSVPNYDTRSNEILKANTIIAIEPFATNGLGKIKESNHSTIYSQINSKPMRDITSRKVLKEIEKYNNLPFNYRWLKDKFSEGQIKLGIRLLLNAGNLRDHPPLPEVNNGIVSQFEHTLFIGENETIVLTK